MSVLICVSVHASVSRCESVRINASVSISTQSARECVVVS